MKKYTALVMTLFILAGLAGCGTEAVTAPELLEPVAVKMDVANAEKGDIYHVTTYQGAVVPCVEELHFLVDGYLEEFSVMTGDMVQKGEVLATLSEELTLKEIEGLEDEIANLVKLGEFSDRQAQADIEIAKEELAIQKESGAAAQDCKVKELEIQKLELTLAQTRELRELELQEKRSSLQDLRSKVGKNEITAPYSGRIVYVSEVEEGAAIQGYTPVIYIADDSRMSLSTDYISESVVEGADKVYARILDKDYDISYIPYDRSELVTMMLSGEEIKTKFSIDTEDAGLQNGQFAVVMVYSQYKENVLTVPVNALYRDEARHYVYKQSEDARVRCDVTVGMTTDTKAEIVEGLEEGDVVYVKE